MTDECDFQFTPKLTMLPPRVCVICWAETSPPLHSVQGAPADPLKPESAYFLICKRELNTCFSGLLWEQADKVSVAVTGKCNSVPEQQLLLVSSSPNLSALKPSITFYCREKNNQTQALLSEPTPAHIPSPNLTSPCTPGWTVYSNHTLFYSPLNTLGQFPPLKLSFISSWNTPVFISVWPI